MTNNQPHFVFTVIENISSDVTAFRSYQAKHLRVFLGMVLSIRSEYLKFLANDGWTCSKPLLFNMDDSPQTTYIKATDIGLPPEYSVKLILLNGQKFVNICTDVQILSPTSPRVHRSRHASV